jgi:hypothetical protein
MSKFIQAAFALVALALAGAASANELTLVNNSDSIAMRIMKIAPDGSETFVNLLPARTPNNNGEIKVTASVGERFVVRNASALGEGVLDVIDVLPTRYENETGGKIFERVKDNHWNEIQHGKVAFTFVQLGVDNGYIRLFDPSRHLELSLPVGGGWCTFRYPATTETRRRLQNCVLTATDVRQVVHVGLNKIPLNDVKHVDVPDDLANLFGYDLTKVDPLNVGAGQKQQIFAALDQRAADYSITQSAAHLAGLDYARLAEGTGGSYSRMAYTSAQLRESWNIGVKVKAGDTGGRKPKTPAAGSASASYSEMKERSQSNQSYFSVSRETRFVYSFKPILGVIELTPAFADAVMDLPTPAQGVALDDSAALRADPAFGVYADFLRQWGSHYPAEVKYGGAVYLSVQYDKETISKLDGMEWNASVEGEGSVKGVPVKAGVSGGQSKESKFKESMAEKLTNFRYVGGQGGPGSWNVSMDDAMPTDVEFAPITDILHPFYFKNGATYADLNPRRAMLVEAIDAAYPFGDDPEAAQPTVYDFELTSWKLDDTARWDNEHVYGRMSMGYIGSAEANPAFFYSIFDRSDAGGARVVLHKGKPQSLDEKARIVLAPGKKPSDASFHLSTDLWFWRRGAAKDLELKDTNTVLKLSALPVETPEIGKWTHGEVAVTYDDDESYRLILAYKWRKTPRWMIAPQEWDRLVAAMP